MSKKAIQATIFQTGLPGIDKPQVVKNFECDSVQELMTELKRMQQGYCDKGDKIIEREPYKEVINGRERTIYSVDSTASNGSLCDWAYEAIVPMKLQQEYIDNQVETNGTKVL
jgi:hypothetical protein